MCAYVRLSVRVGVGAQHTKVSEYVCMFIRALNVTYGCWKPEEGGRGIFSRGCKHALEGQSWHWP